MAAAKSSLIVQKVKFVTLNSEKYRKTLSQKTLCLSLTYQFYKSNVHCKSCVMFVTTACWSQDITPAQNNL